MRNAKLILKENYFTETGIGYTSKSRGDDETLLTMSLGYAIDVAKEHGLPLKEINSIVKKIYNETEVNDDEN